MEAGTWKTSSPHFDLTEKRRSCSAGWQAKSNEYLSICPMHTEAGGFFFTLDHKLQLPLIWEHSKERLDSGFFFLSFCFFPTKTFVYEYYHRLCKICKLKLYKKQRNCLKQETSLARRAACGRILWSQISFQTFAFILQQLQLFLYLAKVSIKLRAGNAAHYSRIRCRHGRWIIFQIHNLTKNFDARQVQGFPFSNR